MPTENDVARNEELPPYLANLGLLSDPFIDTPSGHFFYVGADTEQRLDLMHHLAPYSPLLVVIGERGIGKTALLQQFVARAKENWRIIAITARIDMNRDDFIGALSGALGISLQSQVDPQTQYLSLVAQLRALRQTAQVPILLIDNAQILSVSLLELIHRFCSENDDGHILSIILFGTSQLQSLWNRESLAPLAARVTHTFEITPYSEDETARYIRHRMRAAGASDDGPFDSVTINKIYAASGGIPNRINELSQQVLMNQTIGNKQRQGDGVQGARTGAKQHRPIMAIAGVIILVLLIVGPLRSVLFKSTSLPVSEPQKPIPPSAVTSAPPSVGNNNEERVMRSNDGMAATQTNPKTTPDIEVETPPSTDADQQTAKILPLPPEAETTITELKPAEMTPTTSSEKPKQLPKIATAVPPQSKMTEAKPTPALPPPEAKEIKEIQKVKRVERESSWLENQADSNFTLQLMAVKDEKTARMFIESHKLQDKAAYFPVLSNGQTLYAVVYGSFPKRSEAVLAAKNLPPAWETPNPWIRSFKSLPQPNP